MGLGDGAPWVAATLQLMGATVVLDVFHAVGYLDTVMEQLGWDGDLRQNQRRAWLRGECDAAQWLNTYLPNDDRRQDWSEASCTAARYLLDRVDQMHYPSYRAQGWPIGSGQIEGANKSVIGHRMKRAEQHWSRDGAAGMAAIRAPIQSPGRCPSRPCASSPSQPRISELYGFRLIRYLRPPVEACQGFDLVPLLFQPLALCGEGQLEVRQRLEMTILQRRVRQLPQALGGLQLW